MVEFSEGSVDSGSPGCAEQHVQHIIATPVDMAYEVSQVLIRQHLREVQDTFDAVEGQPVKTVWTTGIQMGVMLAMAAVKSGQLKVR